MSVAEPDPIPLTNLTRDGASAHNDSVVDSEPVADDQDETVYLTGSKFWLVFLSVALVLVLCGLDLNVVATAVPAITDHFHTVADVGWYSAGYRLMSCSFSFFFGKLYQIFRTEIVFITSIVIFLVGSVLCAAADSSRMLVLGRCVCGFATGGIVTGCIVIVTCIVPPHKRPWWGSLLQLFEAVATICGPILGGILVERLSWRWCFWISLPIGGITLLVVGLFLRIPQSTERTVMTWKQVAIELDLIGNLAFVPAMTSLFLALSWAGITYPWSDPKVIGLFVATVLLLAVFALDQHIRQDKAILPPRVMKQRMVIAAAIFSFCANSVLEIIAYYTPTYWQEVKEYTAGRSGYLMLPLLAGSMVGTFAYGSAAAKVGYFPPFMILGSVLMPVAAGLLTTWKVDTSLGQSLASSMLLGFASCIAIMAPQSVVQNFLTPKDMPMGVAIVYFAHNFGPALAISIAQTIFTNRLVSDLDGLVPGLNATSIDDIGLSELTSAIKAQDLDQVLTGIDTALTQTWYLVVAFACLSMAGSLLMEWKPIKKKTT